MTDKYTVRDFLVYFITGLFLLLTLLYRFGISLLEFFRITQTDIKDNSALTVFLLIPLLYILGHIVHAIDLLLLKSGQYIWKFKEKYSLKLKKFKIFWIFNFFNFIISGNRVTGILNEKRQNRGTFWKRVHELRHESKTSNSEYWYLMSDLHKGLALICIAWTILYLCECDKINTIISATLAFLFWIRARHMAKNFVSTINNTNKLE